jgi:hypothetical protein
MRPAALILAGQLGVAAALGLGWPGLGMARPADGAPAMPQAERAAAGRPAGNAAGDREAGRFMICVTRHHIGRAGGSLTFCPAPNQFPGNQCLCPGTSAPGLAVELDTRNPFRSGAHIDPGAQADFLRRLRECCR